MRYSLIPFSLGKDLNCVGIKVRDIAEWFNSVQYEINDKKKSFLSYYNVKEKDLRCQYWDTLLVIKQLGKKPLIHISSIHENKMFYDEFYSRFLFLMKTLCSSYENVDGVCVVNGKYVVDEDLF